MHAYSRCMWMNLRRIVIFQILTFQRSIFALSGPIRESFGSFKAFSQKIYTNRAECYVSLRMTTQVRLNSKYAPFKSERANEYRQVTCTRYVHDSQCLRECSINQFVLFVRIQVAFKGESKSQKTRHFKSILRKYLVNVLSFYISVKTLVGRQILEKHNLQYPFLCICFLLNQL